MNNKPYRSILNEYCQKNKLPQPSYKTNSVDGVFSAVCTVAEFSTKRTTGKYFKKRDAEDESAKLMLELFESVSFKPNKKSKYAGKFDEKVLFVIDLDNANVDYTTLIEEYPLGFILACGGPRVVLNTVGDGSQFKIWQTQSSLNDATDVELIWELALITQSLDKNIQVVIFSTDKIFANCVDILKKRGFKNVSQVY